MIDDRLKMAGRSTDNGQKAVSNAWDRETVLEDYRLAYRSRQASLIGRRETLSGKAKFGIFGDGKEVVQIALAKAFRKGDFRSGYYRDQTLMLALGELTLQEFFAQLYAHADVHAEPATAGRAMNGHYATRLLNPDGSWKNLMEATNSASRRRHRRCHAWWDWRMPRACTASWTS
jgi:2-oxoisovalerate dehydrogenase E1 component